MCAILTCTALNDSLHLGEEGLHDESFPHGLRLKVFSLRRIESSPLVRAKMAGPFTLSLANCSKFNVYTCCWSSDGSASSQWQTRCD